jgi:hypothetical protein
MTFNDILTKHGFKETPLPLWKLRLSDEEFDEIAKALREAFITEKQLFRIAKEAALYYANWWSRKYVGGSRDNTPSREKIAVDLGIKAEQSNDLYSWAKRGLSQLKIAPIVRNGRTHCFRTLLMQGGLPLNSLKKGNNKANYGAFFEGLIKYTNEVDVDYEDISFIDYLPCRNRLSPSFQTVDFYELNLLIIEDFREKGEDSEYWELISAIFDREEGHGNVSVQRIKKLLREKKEKNGNRIRSFSVDWSIRKNETEAALYYTLSIPQRVKQEEISEILRNQYEFLVFLDNREVAKYNRTLADSNGDVFFVKVRGKNDLTEKCINNTDAVIRLSSNGSFQELFYPAPDFSEPILLTGLENLWYVKKKKPDDSINAVLILSDSDWEIITPESLTSNITFYSQSAYWAEAKDVIELKNKSTNEMLTFDNTPYLYRYEILHQPDIKSNKRKLINSKVRFRVIYTIEDTVINNDFEIYFRIKQGQWTRYTNPDCLPAGLLHFKFIYPDKKTEYVSFFNLGNLSVSYSEQSTDFGVVAITNWNGLSLPINEQPGIGKIEKIADSKWRFFRNTESRHYATNMQFRITDQQGSTADMLIAAPFKGVAITEISGDCIDNRSTIALHSLWRYKCLVLGENRMVVTIYHNKNEYNQRNFTYKLEQKNSIPLSDFDESIKNLFTLFGTDHTDFDSFLTVKFNNIFTVFVKPFNLTINRNEWKINQIIRLDRDAKIEHLYAMKVDCEYPDQIDIFKLEKQDDDFVLPKDIDELNGIIVFSDDNNSVDKVRPTFLEMTQVATTFDERLNSIRAKIAENCFIDDIWDETVMYFRLLISKNLPLKTIDYFRIIAESPLSMAKLSLVLLDSKKNITPEERRKGLLSFESEFAIAWHWLDIATWRQALEWYRGKFDAIADYYIQDILTNSLQINPDDTHQLYDFVKNNTESKDCIIDEQEYIQGYTRCVDIYSEDWLSIDEQNRIVYPRLAHNWQNLFLQEYGAAIRTFLWGGAKAALSAMGEDKDDAGNKLLWKPENEMQRRIMFYFWKLTPETYTKLFLGMIQKISYRLNHLNN